MVAEGYKDTEIGVIPVEWEVVKLGTVIDKTQLGVNIKASIETNGIKLLKMGNLTKGGFNFNKFEETDEEIENIGNYYLKYGDFLFNTRNTPELVGKSAVWKWNNNDVIFNSNIMRITFTKNINTFFYNNYFASDVGWKKLKKISKGTTSVGAIYTKDLIGIKIPLPPLKEQEKIADILSTADAKIDAIASQIEKAQTLKKGLLQKLLSEGIGHSKFKDSEIGKIPESWEASLIGNNMTFSGGAQPPRNTFVFEPQEGYTRLLQIRDYKSNKFQTYIPKKLVRKSCFKDDVMIGRYGPPIFQILRGLEGAYNVALIKAIPSRTIDKEFMYYVLVQEKLFSFIENLSQRSSGQTGIDMEGLKTYPLPLPPLEEQKQIADILSTADEKLEVLRAKKEKYETLKKGLLQKLLSGEVRV